MSITQKIRELLPTNKSQPNAYQCSECGREFEVDAPPERVICSSCGSEDVDTVAR